MTLERLNDIYVGAVAVAVSSGCCQGEGGEGEMALATASRSFF